MIEPSHDPNENDFEPSLRELQEEEMSTSFKFASAEFALAREAADVSRAFRQAGLPFDPRTFVGIRVLESCVAERLDPVMSLRLPTIRELIDRSAELAATLLASRV